MSRRRWFIGIGLIAITLLYIWSNSLQSTIRSNEQSHKVLEVIEKVFQTPPLHSDEAQRIVRKAAHVAEFALLGLEMLQLLFVTGKMCKQNNITILFIGLASAVMDETIQVVTQRGSQVMDVWIDFAGFVTGIGIVTIAHMLWRRARMCILNQKKAKIYNTRYVNLVKRRECNEHRKNVPF